MFNYAIEELQKGNDVTIRPKGNSMVPYIKSGDEVTLTPTRADDCSVGTIVLARVRGRVYLHRLSAIDKRGNGTTRYQISNAKGRVNGWASTIYGRVVV